ncbi:MAG: MaoC/PaaZ C-terminal domain-containing protein, partial [Limnobacter sp.]|nr:MaoC/PaaZ C-terminal domain-containing protein [Limnobacter sp.]
VPKTLPKPAEPEPLNVAEAKYKALRVPADQGRKYAKVSNDYNPIHLYATTAKLFGFKQAIAHGMWTAAKTLAMLTPELGKAPKKYDVSFKQPVFLPSSSSLKFVAKKSSVDFELLSDKGSKVQFTGKIKA